MLTLQSQTNHYFFISVGKVPVHCEKFLLATDFNLSFIDMFVAVPM